MPAIWAIDLPGPTAGLIGDTAAIISGSRALSSLPTDAAGRALVEEATAREALEFAFVGTITVSVGQETLLYVMGPGSIGNAPGEHEPFWLDGAVLRFEDMAHSANGSDWDFNDHTFTIAAVAVDTAPTAPPTVHIAPFASASEGGSTGGFAIYRSRTFSSLTVSYVCPPSRMGRLPAKITPA